MNRSFYGNKVLSYSFLTAMIMVAVEVSPVIGIFCAFLMGWKWVVEKRGWRPLSRRWTGILSILALIQVLVQFRTIVGQEPAYTFLLALSALRVMDYKTDRDHRFIVLLGFLLISIKALFSLDIYWIVPSVFAFAGLWYSLLPPAYPQRLRLTIKMFILSMPLAMFMFFAFPRFVLPWAMSRGASQQAEVGFSDEISPGRVADIASTNAMAFRARLHNLPLFITSDMYWRGSVLNVSKGLSWSPGRAAGLNHLQKIEDLPSYDVAIEATSQRYIFALEGTRIVRSEFGGIVPLEQDVFRSTRILSKATVYVGFWDKDYINREQPTDQDLQTPPLRGKVREWVDAVNGKKLNTKGRLAEIKNLFSETGFFYTIAPGTYGPNDLEEFLFTRKRGFCEHYAGAYASLARGLGIPARVVIGYQGGRYNPWGDFWRISQKDAHAWAEVFVDGHWQRVDPTAWVAPLRLSIGAEEFFNLSEEDQKAFAKSANWRPTWANSTMIWDQITLWAEDLNYQWTYFLIDFDRGSQKNFWQNLLEQRGPLILFLIAVALFVYVAVRHRFRKAKKLSPSQKLLLEIEQWGLSKNLKRESQQPPLIYFEKISEAYPQLKPVLEKIGHSYDRHVYAEDLTAGEDIGSLRTEWKEEIKKGPF
ncbi:cysteine protease [Bdellovibrio bacteriovorus]|uniref:Cysteine protease n=1 Tax=Bdellovibrio bacteriovorus TaxID=959 RepID=A0A150WQB0_BDEBC|nr:DUF3488 and transglutaminase-like domain-containing protein [Bdellovibrio bacteriovorus]KYG66683.1 cysteine protease [Bdellovibrio bacteriovorus]